MVFIGREREIGWMRLYLEHEANKILAVTGKANCGKTALMQEVMKRLAKTHTFFYLDLRKHYISDAQDFAISLYHLFYGSERREQLEFMIGPVKIGFKEVLSKEEVKNVVNALLNGVEERLMKVKNPVLVIDELQVLKELYVNGDKKLIDRLLEFFISLTKHQHLAHVIVLTSDSTFYAELYSKSGMHERMDFKLLDELSRQEAIELIRYYVREYSLSLDPEQIYHYTGGNPSLIQSICFMAADVGLEEAVKFKIEDVKWKLTQLAKKGVKLKVPEEYELEEGLVFVEENLLFFNVMSKKYEPQHRIIELAWNELLKA